MSKPSGYIKKPILKKRSMSEIMLRRSLSNSSLLKQAAAAVQAQEKDRRRLERPGLNRATSDYVTFPFSSRRYSKETSLYTSSATSGIISPTSERKRIHFNEQVEQCIAVDVKADDDGSDTPVYMHDGSESDDSAMMMRRSMRRRKRVPLLRKRSKKLSDGKTIAMLPSTTLKDRQEFLEVETALRHGSSGLETPPGSPSSPQETLRGDYDKPKKSRSWFFGGDDSDEETSFDFDGVLRSQSQLTGSDGVEPSQTSLANDLDSDTTGMRRTASGMFLPSDEFELPTPNDGVFSRILDSVNTARDIAHVIWNVGWRK